MRVVAFAQDQLGMGYVEGGMEFGAPGALHAVVWPLHLRTVRQQDRLQRNAARVHGGKRQMTAGVPVLRQDHLAEATRQSIDQWHDLVAVGNSQRTAWAEMFCTSMTSSTSVSPIMIRFPSYGQWFVFLPASTPQGEPCYAQPSTSVLAISFAPSVWATSVWLASCIDQKAEP